MPAPVAEPQVLTVIQRQGALTDNRSLGKYQHFENRVREYNVFVNKGYTKYMKV